MADQFRSGEITIPRYIHRNPVKREPCAAPEDWRWSSFWHSATGEEGVVSEWTAHRRKRERAEAQEKPHPGKGGQAGAPSKLELFLFCVLCVLAAEALDTAGGVQHLLLAGEERVAVGADFHVDVALMSGASGERVSARAQDAYFVVSWVNSSLHNSFRTSVAKH